MWEWLASERRRAPRYGDLRLDIADRCAIDEFGVEQQRRAREHDARDLGLIVGEREHDVTRRVLGARHRLGERAAYDGGGIVERAGQRQHDVAPDGVGQGRKEEGAGERADRFAAQFGALAAHPDHQTPQGDGIEAADLAHIYGGRHGIHNKALQRRKIALARLFLPTTVNANLI